ncbi:MAG: ATP-binding cassette domain-containing protein [Pseudomonadota bacterium]
MALISVHNITKGFSDRNLFSDVSFHINEKDRICLVGPNGAGKSTILRILLEQSKPDDGTVSVHPNTRVGYLPQEIDYHSSKSVIKEVLASIPEGKQTARDEAEARKILHGMSFSQEDMESLIESLSGGWRRRVFFAKLLFEKPDLLLLDEPSNHLDIDNLYWLEDYLKSFSGAVFMIAHDRYLINKVCNKIYEIDSGYFVKYTGNYNLYLEERLKNQELHEKRIEEQKKEMARLQEYINKNKADKRRAAQVRSRQKVLNKMERIQPLKYSKKLNFKIPQPDRGPDTYICAKGVDKAFGEKIVLKNLDLNLRRAEKAAIVGANGCGKTTLLKILAANLQKDAGDVSIESRLSVFYYSQHSMEDLNEEKTVLDEFTSIATYNNFPDIRKFLGLFLFSQNEVEKKIKILSGGERARLTLAKMFLIKPDLLILDEPTNHLDIASREVLENALIQFSGAVIFVSHDRTFIQNIVNNIYEMIDGKLEHYIGNYEDYLRRKAPGIIEEDKEVKSEKEKGKSEKTDKNEDRSKKREEAEERNRIYKIKKKIQDKIDKIEKKMLEAEERMKEIEGFLLEEEVYKNKDLLIVLKKEHDDLKWQLHEFDKEWEELVEELSVIEN